MKNDLQTYFKAQCGSRTTAGPDKGKHTERSKAEPVGVQPLEQPCPFIKNNLRLRLQSVFLHVLWGTCL